MIIIVSRLIRNKLRRYSDGASRFQKIGKWRESERPVRVVLPSGTGPVFVGAVEQRRRSQSHKESAYLLRTLAGGWSPFSTTGIIRPAGTGCRAGAWETGKPWSVPVFPFSQHLPAQFLRTVWRLNWPQPISRPPGTASSPVFFPLCEEQIAGFWLHRSCAAGRASQAPPAFQRPPTPASRRTRCPAQNSHSSPAESHPRAPAPTRQVMILRPASLSILIFILSVWLGSLPSLRALSGCRR